MCNRSRCKYLLEYTAIRFGEQLKSSLAVLQYAFTSWNLFLWNGTGRPPIYTLFPWYKVYQTNQTAVRGCNDSNPYLPVKVLICISWYYHMNTKKWLFIWTESGLNIVSFKVHAMFTTDRNWFLMTKVVLMTLSSQYCLTGTLLTSFSSLLSHFGSDCFNIYVELQSLLNIRGQVVKVTTWIIHWKPLTDKEKKRSQTLLYSVGWGWGGTKHGCSSISLFTETQNPLCILKL